MNPIPSGSHLWIPFKKDITREVILVVVTCGFYDLFWQYQQIRFCNLALGQEKYSFPRWFLFTILTCGIYNFFHEYRMAGDINLLQQRAGLPKSENLPTMSVFLCLFGMPIVVEAVQQLEINRLVEHYVKQGP